MVRVRPEADRSSTAACPIPKARRWTISLAVLPIWRTPFANSALAIRGRRTRLGAAIENLTASPPILCEAEASALPPGFCRRSRERQSAHQLALLSPGDP